MVWFPEGWDCGTCGDGDREVEGVVCSFVYHGQRISSYNGQNKRDVSERKYIPFQGELAQINLILWSNKLPLSVWNVVSRKAPEYQ